MITLWKITESGVKKIAKQWKSMKNCWKIWKIYLKVKEKILKNYWKLIKKIAKNTESHEKVLKSMKNFSKTIKKNCEKLFIIVRKNYKKCQNSGESFEKYKKFT